MKIENAIDAVAIFDPFFSSDRGVAVVRSVLDQARSEPLVAVPDITPNLDEIERLHVDHRVGPLVARAFPSPSLAERERTSMLVQMRLTEVSKEVCTTLDAAGLDSRVLKGLATCELDYDRPSRRHTGDVDLLVRRADLEAAVDVLLGAGLQAEDSIAHVAGDLIDGHNLKGVVLRHASGVEVDIHYRLSRFARPPATDALMEHPSELLSNRFALSPEGRLIHAASHAVLSATSGRRFSSVADIVAIIDNTSVDWAVARRLADELDLTEAVGVALRAEALILDRGHHPGLDWPRPRPLLRALTSTTGRSAALDHVAAMQALPAHLTRRGYLAHRLLPSAELRAGRGGSVAYFRGLVTSARRR